MDPEPKPPPLDPLRSPGSPGLPSPPASLPRLVAHLIALRGPIVRSALSLGVAFVVGFFLASPVLNHIVRELRIGINSFEIYSPMTVILRHVRVAFDFVLGMATPIVVCHFAGVLAPRQSAHGRRCLVAALPVVALLFVTGVLFALFEAVQFVFKLQDAYWRSRGFTIQYDREGLLSFSLALMASFGLLFQLPATVLLLAKLNLIRPDSIRVARYLAIPTMFAVAALIMETLDVLSLAFVALPLYLAFELGLLLSHIFAFSRSGVSPSSGLGAPPAAGASTPPDSRGPSPSRPRRVAEP